MTPRARGALVEVVVLGAVAVLIAVLLRAIVGQAYSIPSESMVPQLKVGDRVAVSKLAYKLHHPRRGDIVVFDCPPRATCPPGERGTSAPVRWVRGLFEAIGVRQPSTEEFIKRVIALPGETVSGRGGRVYVNGHVVVEPYLPAGTITSSFPATRVPRGFLWVMGDNRTNSSDSRVFGVVDQHTVVGRAVLRVWPPTRFAFL